jgi:poly(beta-D-mannuronate) lyase
LGDRHAAGEHRHRRQQRHGLAAWLLAALLLAPAATKADALSAVTIRHPGELVIVRAERLAELAAQPAAFREAVCGATVRKWRSHDPLTRVISPDEYGIDTRAEPFAHTVMRAAAAAFGNADAKARKALVDLLDRWAKGKALTKFDRAAESNFYAVERTLLPVLVAWSLVRDDPEVPETDAQRIHGWLERLMEVRVRPNRPPPSNPLDVYNHSYLTASVEMAWAAMVGDAAMFRKGVEIYQLAIAQMREDGSLPRETERGARALWYQRHAIASLVAIAEMAAVQGYDLYGYQVGGRDLHKAIAFLLAALEDQRLVWPYAEANVSPGPSRNWMAQDLGFTWRRGHGRHYMAWAEPYMRRFPDRPEARELARLLPERDPDFRPMVDEYSGGDTTCFYARPDGLVPIAPAPGG